MWVSRTCRTSAEADALRRCSCALSAREGGRRARIDERDAAGRLQDRGRDDSGHGRESSGRRSRCRRRGWPCAAEVSDGAGRAARILCHLRAGRADAVARHRPLRPAKIGSIHGRHRTSDGRRSPRTHEAGDEEAGAVQGPAAERRLHDDGLRGRGPRERSSTRRRPRRIAS